MCKGFFRNGYPMIEASLISPIIKRSYRLLFLIDTGSDKTSITTDEARRMGIDISRLPQTKSYGISGKPVQTYIVPDVEIVFVDFSPLHRAMHLHIEKLDNIVIIEGLPMNLSGMDVISRFNLVIDDTEQIVELNRSEFGKGSHIGITVPVRP